MGRSSFDDLQLLISELIAEPVATVPDGREAELRLHAELHEDSVHVEALTDGSAYRLQSRRPLPGEPGWGLHLVRDLVERWGVSHAAGMASAWFELSRGR